MVGGCDNAEDVDMMAGNFERIEASMCWCCPWADPAGETTDG